MDHEPPAGVFERLGQDQHKKRRLSEIGQTGLAEPLRQASGRRRIRSPRRSPGRSETSPISFRIGTIAGCLSRFSSFSSRARAAGPASVTGFLSDRTMTNRLRRSRPLYNDAMLVFADLLEQLKSRLLENSSSGVEGRRRRCRGSPSDAAIEEW